MIQTDPFRELDALFGRLGPSPTSTPSAPIDAYRRGEDVWVHMDLPGVAADSLEITLERSVLTVVGERATPRQEGDTPYLSERRSGPVRRQLHLGEGLDAEHLEADLHDGVLTLRIPVAERAKPRRIELRRPDAIDATASS